MNGPRRPLIAGNWKMFGRRADLGEIAALASSVHSLAGVIDIVVCPPAPYIREAVAVAGSLLQVGAQDCSAIAADAARTGEMSAAMIADCGARYVIVGHSERRAQHGETDAMVRQKAEAALGAGLVPIICVGETAVERAAGRAAEVVAEQLSQSAPRENADFVVAYEPVWAIGGDRTPTLGEIAEVHCALRSKAQTLHGADVRILYGGSVNPANAGDILALTDVDGALVGRASLKSADFRAIVVTHPAALRTGN